MAHYKTIKILNRTHIVREVFRTEIPDTNYEETGKALVGVCCVGESFEEWVKRRRK